METIKIDSGLGSAKIEVHSDVVAITQNTETGNETIILHHPEALDLASHLYKRLAKWERVATMPKDRKIWVRATNGTVDMYTFHHSHDLTLYTGWCEILTPNP